MKRTRLLLAIVLTLTVAFTCGCAPEDTTNAGGSTPENEIVVEADTAVEEDANVDDTYVEDTYVEDEYVEDDSYVEDEYVEDDTYYEDEYEYEDEYYDEGYDSLGDGEGVSNDLLDWLESQGMTLDEYMNMGEGDDSDYEEDYTYEDEYEYEDDDEYEDEYYDEGYEELGEGEGVSNGLLEWLESQGMTLDDYMNMGEGDGGDW